MPNKDSKKLSLCQVLEEEYEHLHDNLPVDHFNFSDDEFKSPFTIEKLRKVITDNYTICCLNAVDNTIQWLNEILKIPNFYDSIKTNKKCFSEEILALVDKTKTYREKNFLDLDDTKKTKINKLNRLLLEELYPQETPKTERFPKIYNLIHKLKPKRTALCLSGGGIRSATFSLGVIQGLAKHGLLGELNYLSTVSGGGYIGSWLTAWIRRHPEGLKGVAKELGTVSKSQLDHEPEPIKHLRTYSNYLTPKLGIMSADMWTLVATYLRNLLLTWFLFIPLLLAALAIPRTCFSVVLLKPSDWIMWSIFGLGSAAIICSILFIGVNYPSSSNRNNRHQSFILRSCLLPLVLSAILLTTFWAWYLKKEDVSVLYFIISGIIFHFVGWLLGYLPWFWRTQEDKQRNWEGFGKFTKILFSEILRAGIIGAAIGYPVWLTATHFFPAYEYYVCFAAPAFLGFFLIAVVLYVAFFDKTDLLKDKDLEWLGRFGAWVLIAITIWCAGSSLVIFGPLWLLKLWEKAPTLIASTGGISGIITALLGYRSKIPFTKTNSGSPSLLFNNILITAATIFSIFLIMALSLGTDILVKLFNNKILPIFISLEIINPVNHLNLIYVTPCLTITILFCLLISIISIMALSISINKTSLHYVYRNRLIRAYLGASNPDRNTAKNKFTDFNVLDNIYMKELIENKNTAQKLFYVVNTTLNLVKANNLAWQQRMATSFTITPLHSGCSNLPSVGYRKTEAYGGKGECPAPDVTGITLGTAMTISGAAASPNMGYHSSPVLSFLLTFFNVRIGMWLGNPSNDKTFGKESPTCAIFPIIREAFGLTNEQYRYVYLSDGGHFENLGLYEMILRRCHFIVLVDASCDTGKVGEDYKFGDLGNAIRKIRIDLGVEIEIDNAENNVKNYSIDDLIKSGKHCIIFNIKYPEVDESDVDENANRKKTISKLIYIKPTLCGNEPVDIINYKKDNPKFPHESTSDQWFSESQFESYRKLGLHAIDQIAGKNSTYNDLDKFFKQAENYASSSKYCLPDIPD